MHQPQPRLRAVLPLGWPRGQANPVLTNPVVRRQRMTLVTVDEHHSPPATAAAH